MVPIPPNGASSRRCVIDGAGEPYRGPDEATREPNLVVRLDEQVDVIGLHRVVDDAKPGSCGTSDRPPELGEDELLAQAGEPGAGSEGDVNGLGFLVFGPSAMPDAAASMRAFSTRTRAPTATRSKLQLLLAEGSH